ncbi:MAG: acetoacetate decarboxylase family protein [Haloarculaceae archaeon]
MRFVRPDEERRAVRDAVRQPAFLDATALTVSFRTDPDRVEELLPPGLEPADRPLARAEVVSVGRSNCVGPFDGGGLYVRARHGDREGAYCLSMPMSTDAAVRWGRETLGEPKKVAEVALDRTDDRVRGTVSRSGERLLDLDARLTEEGDPRSGEATVFHYKYLPAASGEGFHADPALVAVTLESTQTSAERGSADLSLGSTAHDPLGSLPVESVRGATYAETDLVLSAEEVATVDPEAFEPYAFGVGMDDWLALAND